MNFRKTHFAHEFDCFKMLLFRFARKTRNNIGCNGRFAAERPAQFLA